MSTLRPVYTTKQGLGLFHGRRKVVIQEATKTKRAISWLAVLTRREKGMRTRKWQKSRSEHNPREMGHLLSLEQGAMKIALWQMRQKNDHQGLPGWKVSICESVIYSPDDLCSWYVWPRRLTTSQLDSLLMHAKWVPADWEMLYWNCIIWPDICLGKGVTSCRWGDLADSSGKAVVSKPRQCVNMWCVNTAT